MSGVLESDRGADVRSSAVECMLEIFSGFLKRHALNPTIVKGNARSGSEKKLCF
jgi:hypothetical protein